MRHAPARYFGFICAVALTLGMVLSGCGSSANATGGHIAATSTATTVPTAIPLPTATTDPATVEFAGCAVPDALAPAQPQYIAVGDLNVTAPLIPPGLDYAGEAIPNDEPSAPYQIAASAVTNFQPDPAVNPPLSTGYLLQVCNQSSVAQTLTSFSVAIANFTPSSGPVTVWQNCQNGPYDAAVKQTTGGCGGGIGGVDYVAATLPSDSSGASAPVTGLSLPLTIAPNKSITFLITMNGLTSQGTYALTFDLGVGGASPASLAPSDGSFLIAPSAIVWTGTACQTAAMLAQIPAATQDTYYVCPPVS
ncbi:MAG: hypothetical protein ACLQUY_28900 [Ktedonobacterales bacterium]